MIYRTMLPGDLESALDLWLATWPGANRERAARYLTSDPRYLERTFVAASEDGQILATAHYWLRLIRDANGRPEPVGCISHVSTAENARRQGHARTLVQMAHKAIKAEGCRYALLFSSAMGVPLYESLGYTHVAAPFWQGLITRESPQASDTARYSVTEHETLDGPLVMQSLSHVYDAYNAERPASMVRAPGYWSTFMTTQVGPGSWPDHRNLALLARSPEGEIAAYSLVHFSNEALAHREFNLDQVLTISEIGALPGHEAAIPALLSHIISCTRPGDVGGRGYLPRDQRFEAYVRTFFGGTLHDVDDRRIMAFPLADGVTPEEIQATFSAPGACFWQTDDF